jgi:hypothetical protein
MFNSCNEKKSQNDLLKEKRISQIKQINIESNETFNTALLIIKDSGYRVWIDSVTTEFHNIQKDSAELGLKYAQNLKEYGFDLHFKGTVRQIKDTARQKILFKQNHERIVKQNLRWANSKAGKIQSKHPNWKKNVCEKLANDEVWIGMTLNMLKAQKGNPSTANPSNYGNGVEWQWCWPYSTPSCFYGNSDEIITAYN